MSRPYPATRRQMDLLRFIHGYQRTFGYSPSTEEMRAGLGLDSGSGIVRLLDGLEECGHLTRLRHRARAIDVLNPPTIPSSPNGAPLYAVPGFGEAG